MRTLLLMTVGVLAVSLSGPLMAAMVVPPLAIAFWRNALRDRGARARAWCRRRDEVGRLRGRTAWWVVASGAALAAALRHLGHRPDADVGGVGDGDRCLQIAWVVAWQLLRGERFEVRVVAGLVLAFAGVLVVSGVDLTLSVQALVGDLLALVGGVAAAAYMVIGARARQTTVHDDVHVRLLRHLRGAPAGGVPGRRAGLGGYPAAQWGLLVLVTRDRAADGALGVQPPARHHARRCWCRWRCCSRCPARRCSRPRSSGRCRRSGALVGLVVILAGMALVIVYNRAPAIGSAPVD